jgi:hypothetical protein
MVLRRLTPAADIRHSWWRLTAATERCHFASALLARRIGTTEDRRSNPVGVAAWRMWIIVMIRPADGADADAVTGPQGEAGGQTSMAPLDAA